MFFNFPLIYLMLVSFDLTISAMLTTRNASGTIHDTRSGSAAFRIISVILAWVYLVGVAGLVALLTVVIM